MSTSAGRVMPLPKGAYDSETTYHILDMVSYGNGTFICKQTSTGNDPSFDADTDYWQLMARSGDVSGVKGNAEETYRDGNVNITFENIISGALPVSKGGTGGTTYTANAVMTGNGTNALIGVGTANGAMYATESNGAAQFGTLPIAQGGTGAVSAAGALTNLGALGTSGASTNTTVAYTTKDAAKTTTEKTNSTTDQPSTVEKLTSGETLATMIGKISAMFKNIRRLWNTVGTTAIDTAYGNTVTAQLSNLKSYNTYSTSETWTGKYWIDGKKIYRKVIDVSLGALNAWKDTDISSLNASFITYIYVDILEGTSRHTSMSTDGYFLGEHTNTRISLMCKDSRYANSTGFAILEYTKTT